MKKSANCSVFSEQLKICFYNIINKREDYLLEKIISFVCVRARARPSVRVHK